MRFCAVHKWWLGFCLLGSVSSCSLLKIESAQEPLGKTSLNMRILAQELARESSDRSEYAADSVLELTDDPWVQRSAILWKINALKAYERAAYQTVPEIALLDVWSVSERLDRFMKTSEAPMYFGTQWPVMASATGENLREARRRASGLLKPSQFEMGEELVQAWALRHPVSSPEFTESTLREVYYDTIGVPDSLAVQTVGTLSEVVSDMANRISFTAAYTPKLIRWQSELYVREQGWDSIQVNAYMRQLNDQVGQLVAVVSSVPGQFDETMLQVSRSVQAGLVSLEQGMGSAVEGLHRERIAVDSIISREREAFSALLSRERDAIAAELNLMVDDFMASVERIIRYVLFFVILALIVIFFLPFGLGYLTGRWRERNKSSAPGPKH